MLLFPGLDPPWQTHRRPANPLGARAAPHMPVLTPTPDRLTPALSWLLLGERGRMKTSRTQDKAQKWRFKNSEENVHGTKMPSGKSQMSLCFVISKCCVKSVTGTALVTKSSSSKRGRKIGPSHIRRESGHFAKPILVKPVLFGPHSLPYLSYADRPLAAA